VFDRVGQHLQVVCVHQQRVLAEGDLNAPAALAPQNVPVAGLEQAVGTV